MHDNRIASVGAGSQPLRGSGTGLVEFSLGQQGGIRNNLGCPPNALELALAERRGHSSFWSTSPDPTGSGHGTAGSHGHLGKLRRVPGRVRPDANSWGCRCTTTGSLPWGALKPVIRRHPRGNGSPITFAPGVLFLPGPLSAGVQLNSSRLQPTQQFG